MKIIKIKKMDYGYYIKVLGFDICIVLRPGNGHNYKQSVIITRW